VNAFPFMKTPCCEVTIPYLLSSNGSHINWVYFQLVAYKHVGYFAIHWEWDCYVSLGNADPVYTVFVILMVHVCNVTPNHIFRWSLMINFQVFSKNISSFSLSFMDGTSGCKPATSHSWPIVLIFENNARTHCVCLGIYFTTSSLWDIIWFSVDNCWSG